MNEYEALLAHVAGVLACASEHLEAAAREWQEAHPAEQPICFHAACAKFVADSFASASDETWESLIQRMRDERREWQQRGRM